MRLRLLAAVLRRPPWPALLAVSAAGWLGLALAGRALALPEICGAIGRGGLQLFWLLNAPTGLLASWLLMLLAGMAPLLARPVQHLRRRSLARRRSRALVLFAAGYAAVWTLAGGLLAMLAVAVHAAAGGDPVTAAALAVAIACLWQLAPGRAHCLDGCHRMPRLAAFGIAADRDSLAFGAGHACWCGGTCWAAMLVPLCAGDAHLLAMALIAPLLWAERIRPPRRATLRLA